MQENKLTKKARLPVWRRLSWRLGISFLLLTAIGILLSGLLQYRAQERELRETLGSLLLNIARTGALLVDPQLHAEVETTLTQDSAAYRDVRAALAMIQDENQIQTPIYTLTGFDSANRKAHFMVTSRGPGLPGEPYPLAPELVEPLGRAFREGVATYTDIYRNQSGTWITAFAPIRDAQGRVFAVLDVDYRVEVYLNRLAEVRRQLYLNSLAGALLALAAGLLIARQITQPITQLSALARSVVEGDLSTRVQVAARDEIGMLANVFHLMVERVQVSNRSVVDVLVRALEARAGQRGSLQRLAKAAMALTDPARYVPNFKDGSGADRLELSATQREALELGALLHNIGEIRIPEALLQKTEPLTAEEQQTIEQHPLWGVEILETVPLLTPALDVVGAHHERYDGAGYPQGLRGEEIPLTARIFAVVDALDSMTHDAPNRRARTLSEALEALKAEAGKQFDPRIVEAALSIPADQWAELLEPQTTDMKPARSLESD
ncbi:MAG TPA: HD domain-containing phosphohydrolase [Anaerolineales bacterium]|nr:HD domain-containing phosphohydrolase [Anaerolineales bacterium]